MTHVFKNKSNYYKLKLYVFFILNTKICLELNLKCSDPQQSFLQTFLVSHHFVRSCWVWNSRMNQVGADVSFQCLFFFFFSILFIHERHKERGRHRQREKQRSKLLMESLMWDLIPGPGIMPWAEGRCSTTEPPRGPFSACFRGRIRELLKMFCLG